MRRWITDRIDMTLSGYSHGDHALSAWLNNIWNCQVFRQDCKWKLFPDSMEQNSYYTYYCWLLLGTKLITLHRCDIKKKNKRGLELDFMAKESANTNGSKRWKLGLVKSYLLIQANNSVCALIQTLWSSRETQQHTGVWSEAAIAGLHPTLIVYGVIIFFPSYFIVYIQDLIFFWQHAAHMVHRNVSAHLSIQLLIRPSVFLFTKIKVHS